MTLTQLRYFIVLAQNLHYTRSAELLYISQPSLSYAISELEKELGVALFDKDNRKIRLNPNGHPFLHCAEHAIAILDEGVHTLRTVNGMHEPKIRLGYFYSLSSFVPNLISQFYEQERKPALRFDFVQEQNEALIDFCFERRSSPVHCD